MVHKDSQESDVYPCTAVTVGNCYLCRISPGIYIMIYEHVDDHRENMASSPINLQHARIDITVFVRWKLQVIKDARHR
jgi:hypothetical protein